MPGRKTGRLSKAETDYIRSAVGKTHPAEMADKLGRTVDTVLKFIKEHCPSPTEPRNVEQEELRAGLKNTQAWKQLQHEFEPDEVRYFEEQYVALMKQFREDVLAAEENQIFKSIKYDIMMGRCMRALKRTNREIDRLEREQEEAAQAAQSGGGRDKDGLSDRALHLQTMIEAQYANKQAKSSEFTKLESQHQRLMEALKATRQQRVNKIETGKKSIIDLIKQLQDDDYADREGRQAELMRGAAEKELKRLGTPRKFADETIDQPVLSADTVEMFRDGT